MTFSLLAIAASEQKAGRNPIPAKMQIIEITKQMRRINQPRSKNLNFKKFPTAKIAADYF
jgi:hypothetical protein